MKKSLLAVLALSCLILVPGCQKKGGTIRPKDLDSIKIGMTKKELIDQIGEPVAYLQGNPAFNTLDAFVYAILGQAEVYFYGLLYICSFGFYTPDNVSLCLLSFSNEKLEKCSIVHGGHSWTNIK